MSLYLVMLLAGLVGGLVFAMLGRWVADQKHRDPNEGALLGFLLGPFGVLVELLLPTKEAPKRKAVRRLDRSGWQPPRDEAFDQEAANWITRN